MDKIEELRMLIMTLVNRIDDEKVLRHIYALVNRIYCRQ